MSYGSSISRWKPWIWVRLDLIFWYFPRKFTSSSRSTKFKYIFPWIIYQMITKTIPISMRIVVSSGLKWGIPSWVWQKVNGDWESNMIRISQSRENDCRTSTSIQVLALNAVVLLAVSSFECSALITWWKVMVSEGCFYS